MNHKNQILISPQRITNYNEINKIDRLICTLCKCILIDPYICKNEECLTMFCADCLELYFEEKVQKCPKCKNMELDKLSNESYINKVLQSLTLNCINQNYGCTEILLYSLRDYHESSCSYNSIMCEYCNEKLIQSNYEGHQLRCIQKNVLNPILENTTCSDLCNKIEHSNRTICNISIFMENKISNIRKTNSNNAILIKTENEKILKAMDMKIKFLEEKIMEQTSILQACCKNNELQKTEKEICKKEDSNKTESRCKFESCDAYVI